MAFVIRQLSGLVLSPPSMFNVSTMLGIGRNAFTPNTVASARSRVSLWLSRSPQFPRSSRFYSRGSDNWIRYTRQRGTFNQNNIDWRSLAKPALFTAAFCTATTFAVPLIVDNIAALRRNPAFVVYGIVGLNVAGFFAWKSPVGYRMMARYGLLVKNSMRSPWTMLGSAFSHQDGLHLLFNMVCLTSFGVGMAGIVGTSGFLTMYLNLAVISSLVSLAIPTLMRSAVMTGSLGASGAIFGVFGAFSYLFPKAPLAVFFVPVPGGAWFVFLASIAFNAAGIFYKLGRYDYAAHLGGCIAGVAYGWWFDKQRRERVSRRLRLF